MTRLELRFTMPDAKLGTNHRRRLHWTEINDLTEKWKSIHLSELKAQCDPLPHFEYVLVEFEQILPNFRSVVDNDNLSGKGKTVLDAMTLAGLWADDSPSHVEVAYRARQQKGVEPYLRVFMTEIPRPEPLEPLAKSSSGTTRSVSRYSPRGREKSSPRSSGESSPRASGWAIKRRAPSFATSQDESE